MKVLLLVAFACVAALAFGADDAQAWIAPPPDFKHGPDDKKALDRTDIFEVVASKVSIAISSELAQKQVVEISEQTAAYYTGSYYRCPKGKKPHLVRAVYGFGGTGHYLVFRHDNAVWVEHQSLGSGKIIHQKSALVVNLDFSPTSAYATSSVIE